MCLKHKNMLSPLYTELLNAVSSLFLRLKSDKVFSFFVVFVLYGYVFGKHLESKVLKKNSFDVQNHVFHF